jgi:formylglycine-generating enzyme required for sulfatase activity
LRRQEQERQRLAEEEARRREAERQAQLAEQLRIHLIKEEENSRALAQFAKRGITPGSGKSFKDCDSCPDMVLIPAGKFVMGSRHGAASEQPEHEVKISYPLAVAKTEITQTQFKAVMGRNPSHFQAMSDDLPVENVSWQDAQEYVKQLSSMTGHTYRLLSEAEWEYACRAGGRHEYCGSADIERASWYSFNSGRKTHVVATKAPNAWGLYDMSGNVWEWVQDCTGNYSSTPSDGTAWTSGNCVERMVRGGSYVDVPRSTRAAVRDWFGVSSRGSSLGFRPARIISP